MVDVALVVGVIAAVLSVAALRIRALFADRKKPLLAVGTARTDSGVVRLIIRNPNRSAVGGVRVTVKSVVAYDTTHPDLPLPTMGYRFPWSSWTSCTSSLAMDLEGGHEATVVIAARIRGHEPPNLDDGSPTFVFVHAAGRQVYPQARGTYRLTLRLDSIDLPSAGEAVVDVRFDQHAQLALLLLDQPGDLDRDREVPGITGTERLVLAALGGERRSAGEIAAIAHLEYGLALTTLSDMYVKQLVGRRTIYDRLVWWRAAGPGE